MEQSGVLVWLSTKRPRVQIPLGGLDGTVRKTAKRPSSNLGDRLWVRFPPVLLSHASAGHWRALVAVTHPRSRCAGSTPARRTRDGWSVRLSVGGHRPPSRKDGFDSHTGYMAKWWNRQTHDAQNVAPTTGMGVRLSPWSLRSGLESGFQHGLISRSTPVQIRPPQFGDW